MKYHLNIAGFDRYANSASEIQDHIDTLKGAYNLKGEKIVVLAKSNDGFSSKIVLSGVLS